MTQTTVYAANGYRRDSVPLGGEALGNLERDWAIISASHSEQARYENRRADLGSWVQVSVPAA
jgi:hypothetical protein